MKRKISFILILAMCITSLGGFGGFSSPIRASAANKPKLTVKYSEVKLKNAKLTKKSENEMTYSVSVKNESASGTIKKIIYYYQIQVLEKKTVTITPEETPQVIENPEATASPETSESPIATEVPEPSETPSVTETPEVSPTPAPTPYTKTEWVPKTKKVSFTVKNIAPGKTSKKVTCEGDYSGNLSAMKLLKVKLYAGTALYTYDAQKKTGKTTWGSKDKKAPAFSGWVGKKSIYSNIPVRVCYADRKNTYNFKEHVKATDDRDGTVKFSVDASGINWSKEGIYKVWYTAKDAAGNIKKTWAKVQVYKKGMAEEIADQALASIVKKSWSDEKKLRAIYNYVHSHCSYTDSGSHTNWRKSAVNGLRYRSGDCFTFYSVSRLLITRAGIPNLEVTRYPKRAGSDHWWNLVYVRGGWYHFDTTPRRRKGKFCLVTHAQLKAYSSGRTFQYRTELLPKQATKKISPNP